MLFLFDSMYSELLMGAVRPWYWFASLAWRTPGKPAPCRPCSRGVGMPGGGSLLSQEPAGHNNLFVRGGHSTGGIEELRNEDRHPGLQQESLTPARGAGPNFSIPQSLPPPVQQL